MPAVAAVPLLPKRKTNNCSWVRLHILPPCSPWLFSMTVPLLKIALPEPWKQPPFSSAELFVQKTSLNTIVPVGSHPYTWTTVDSVEVRVSARCRKKKGRD